MHYLERVGRADLVQQGLEVVYTFIVRIARVGVKLLKLSLHYKLLN